MKLNIPSHITVESLHQFAVSNNCILIQDGVEYSMVPKSQRNDALMHRHCTYSMQDVAKFLGIGSKTLFQQLRDAHILNDHNLPYQRYIDAGYFRVLTKSWDSTIGAQLYGKTVVTRSGYHWLQAKLAEKSDT